ncbi:MAG: carbamoyl phosphate synthase large subunit, partial [Pseudomonadota bacterium]
RDADKSYVVSIANDLLALGFTLSATRGTCDVLKAAGIDVQLVNKVNEGQPHIVDDIKNNDIKFIINTTEGKRAIADSAQIRRSALAKKVFYTTTMAGAQAVCLALKDYATETTVRSLQSLH